MKRFATRYPILLVLAMLIAGCQPPGSNGSTMTDLKDDSAKLVTIGDTHISENMADSYSQMTRRKAYAELSADEQARLLDDVINVRVAALKARELGLDKDAKTVRELSFMQDGYLAQALMRKHSQDTPIDDAKIQAAYQERIAGNSGTEYKARHILLRTEEEATDVISQLQAGAEFAKLAEENSIGPTARNGGDLGWFTPDRMVKEFSDAVIAMDQGTFSTAPVQTQFGFHVILAEDSREAQPPTLEQLRPQLQAQLEQQRALDFIESLKSDFQVERVEPAATE